MSDSERQNNQAGRPEYGAMRSDYPAYNPYVYGAPDPVEQPSDQDGSARQHAPAMQSGGARPGYDQQQPYGQPDWRSPAGGQQSQNGQPFQQPADMRNGQPAQGGRRQPNRMSRRYGVDLDDPRQNPLYGHWDPYAIIAFVIALLFSNMPILPAAIGGLAMWRTRTFHMKGFGLALAAVIINVLTSLLVLWAAYNGMSLTDVVLQMYGLDGTGAVSGGDTQSA